MGEAIGLGITHYPPLGGGDKDMAGILKGRLADPDLPAEARDMSGWPQLMRDEWGDDEGTAGAARHREAVLRGIRKVRAALDDFDPDFVLIWGDDQYENFKESIIPPFCVLAYDDMEIFPWKHAAESAMFSDNEDEWGGGRPNVWGEGKEYSIKIRGQREAAKEIVTRLLEQEFDVSYAYEPLNHPGFAHAFLNSVLYLDYDRRGFPWPMIGFQINCYGRAVISHRGYVSRLADRGRPPDPPSPMPSRVFDLGGAVARICKESPWRVALIASSSWSHAFLNENTSRMRPDIAFDRKMYDALNNNRLEEFRNLTLTDIEGAGNQEMLNWVALAGAMNALGQKCIWSDMVETYLFNSSKVSAIFETTV